MEAELRTCFSYDVGNYPAFIGSHIYIERKDVFQRPKHLFAIFFMVIASVFFPWLHSPA
jgi:hypothetical protein